MTDESKSPALHKLANREDILSRIHSRGAITKHYVDSPDPGSTAASLTYDAENKKVIFEYPEIKRHSLHFANAQAAIEQSFTKGTFAGLNDVIVIDKQADHLKVEMPEDKFRKIFRTQIEILLAKPVNILGRLTGETLEGSDWPGNTTFNPDTGRVAVTYPQIRGTGRIGQVRDALENKGPAVRSFLLKLDKASRLTISMPASAYEQLTGAKLDMSGGRGLA